ncbi:trypco2 family protein [Streptomyces sp. MS1.HAVA.3]|uniref:Trypco2 family protein n=1 Tax=Streptomyces caledonius TaxID=3134107 RepID=A0ABU8TZ94_9ACTN
MEIGPAETIKALRGELAQAMADGGGQPVRLRVQSVKLDVQVAVTASAEAQGGVKFWVLSAGGKAAGAPPPRTPCLWNSRPRRPTAAPF